MVDEKKLSVGDVVTLKSGGPRMTVDEYVNDYNVSCCWFEGNYSKEVSRATFSVLSLELYPA